MMAVPKMRTVLVVLSTLSIVSCAEIADSGKTGFQSQYETARTALEKGDYAKANRLYARMQPQSGPLDERVQLEHAHSVLRAGDYDKAAKMAAALANSGNGPARGAALSVKATADHEAGLMLLQSGDQAQGAARLKTAQKAIEEVLSAHPDFDPLGSLAGRQASINVRLKALR